ncbi:MAG: acyl-CoA dehydrogenase family protein [Proteobacteria bacterium]|nr:acyl-CoA dehydrogenase family protein [Pseudomonadota bacterium]
MSDVVSLPENKKPLEKKLQAVLEGDFADIRQQARDFVTQPDFLTVQSGISKEEYREKTIEWVKKLAASGYSKLPYDPKYGGRGEMKKFLNFVETIAHQDMSFLIKQGVNFGLFGMGMYSLGTEKHHAKYLPDIMNGKLLGGFAMTEVSGGSDVQSITTEAVYDHAQRSFTINTPSDSARKAFIGNAALHGEMMVVFAQLKMDKNAESEGVHAFMVPVRDKAGKVLPGVTIEDCGDKIGLNGIDNGYLHFQDIKIPYDAMLDRFAHIDEAGKYQSDIAKKAARFFKMISTLVTGRVAVAAASLSGAKNALTTALTFADQRVVFGSSLLDKQSAQSRLFPRLADAYAMHFATRLLMDKHISNAPDLETMAAALKAKSSDDAIRTIDEARLVEGGTGYLSKSRYGALRNDVDVFRTFEGDNTVLRLLVAKNRLTELKQEFQKVAGIKKTLKMASLALGQLSSKFNLSKANTHAGHLLDPDFQEQTFAQRERTMMLALSKKIKKYAKETGGFRAAVDKCQDDMLAYADAYTERVMAEQFIKAVREQTDPETKAVLKKLCDVFATNTMLKHSTWYIENGYMTPHKTRALAEMAPELNQKLRSHAVALVQAFAIPKELLSSPERKPVAAPDALPKQKVA